MAIYFPALFDSATTKEYYGRLKRRTLLVLNTIIRGPSNDTQNEIDEIDEYLLELALPEKYDGPDGFEVKYIRNFEQMSAMLSQHLSRDPKKMTVLEYYQSFEYLKKHFKPKKGAKRASNKPGGGNTPD